MKDSWICRDYQDGDEYQILTLYKQVNDREMALSHWKWKFAESPFGKGIIKLMFDDNWLIGHYAVIPMNVQVQNTVVKAALSVNTMTHPDYERQGIFSYLAEETYSKCRQDGYGFVYGFPNENSYYGFTRKLSWTDLGRITPLEKKLGIDKIAKKDNNGYIRPVAVFDERVNVLWNKVKDDNQIIVSRTKDFLNWRFVENPAVEYPKFVYQNDTGEISGYFVLKTYAKSGEVKGHIVDMLCINENDTVNSFLNYSYNYYTERGINSLSCWAPEGSFYAHVLEQEGFIRKELETYFGVRVLDGSDGFLQNVEQINNWHLTMGDSDAY